MQCQICGAWIPESSMGSCTSGHIYTLKERQGPWGKILGPDYTVHPIQQETTKEG